MAHQLTHEVIRHTPTGLTQAERNVLMVLAYHCRVEDRRWAMSIEDLQLETDLSESGLRKALGRLAERGLECRVTIGHDRAGRPQFAHRGAWTTYQLPHLPAPDGCACQHQHDSAPRKGAPPVAPYGRKGATTGAPFAHNGATVVAPSIHNGATAGAPFAEKGATPGPQRGSQGSPLTVLPDKDLGEPSEVTPGPRATPPPPDPSEEKRWRPSPRPRTAAAPLAQAAIAAAPAAVHHPDSLCQLPDCFAPKPCGGCGRVRDEMNAAAAAAARSRTSTPLPPPFTSPGPLPPPVSERPVVRAARADIDAHLRRARPGPAEVVRRARHRAADATPADDIAETGS